MIGTILAIDPGTTESAYVLYNAREILGFAKLDNHQMILVVEECKADVMAIETPRCYGMEVGATLMDTCEWAGIFRHAFGLKKAYRVFRKSQNKELGIDSVCMHLCHNNRAKDPNIRRAIIDRYGGDDKAFGGVNCPKCKGKGWFGAGRLVCPVCNGDKWRHPPGPLYEMTGYDVFAALAVAITFDETWVSCRRT